MNSISNARLTGQPGQSARATVKTGSRRTTRHVPWARDRFWLACWLSVVVASANGASGPGIQGTVTLSPSCAGAQKEGLDCRAPYQDVELRLLSPDAAVVASGRTSASGSYQFKVPAGRFRLLVMVPVKVIRCPVKEVVVDTTSMTVVDIDCDSGMR